MGHGMWPPFQGSFGSSGASFKGSGLLAPVLKAVHKDSEIGAHTTVTIGATLDCVGDTGILIHGFGASLLLLLV